MTDEELAEVGRGIARLAATYQRAIAFANKKAICLAAAGDQQADLLGHVVAKVEADGGLNEEQLEAVRDAILAWHELRAGIAAA